MIDKQVNASSEGCSLGDYLPLRQAVQLATGRNIHVSTAFRWTQKGVLAGDERIRLKSRRIGGQRMTKVGWVNDFIDAQNADEPDPAECASRSQSKRDKDHQRADQELDNLLNEGS